MVRYGKRDQFAGFLDKVLADTSPRYMDLAKECTVRWSGRMAMA